MSVQSQTFGSFPAFTVPRGARVAADLFVRLLRWLTTPATPRRRDEAVDLAAVRALAQRMQNSDPGFAADLYAAVARHEGGQ